MKVMSHKRTAMNFFMLFAISAANFILVIGRRFTVKSVVEICGEYEIDANQMSFMGFTFESQGEHPTSWKVGLAKRIDGVR